MGKFLSFITPYLKYAFHGAIILFYFLIITRFVLANGEHMTTFLNLCRILGSVPLIFMAMWSHFVASGKDGLEPGYIEWEHFRDADQLKHVEDKKSGRIRLMYDRKRNR